MSAETDRPPDGRWAARFFTIWSAQAVSLFGSSLVSFALVWWLTAETGSATVLATGTLVSLLPGIVIGPFAGALVDRWNRRLVIMVADGTVALATLALALIYAGGHMQPWHVYILMFVRAVGGSFHWAAMTASTSLMVPNEQLTRVQGMNQTLQGINSIITPPLGALLLSLLPLNGVMAIDVSTAVLAIVPLFFIAIPQPERRMSTVGASAQAQAANGARTTILQDVREGLVYIWAWRPFVTLLGSAIVANFVLAPAFALSPILVTQHFGGGAIQLGWMSSAFGVGMLSGGLTLSAWGGFRNRVQTLLLGLGLMGVGVFVIGVAPAAWLWMGIGGMFLAGFANPIANGPLHALVQSTVDPALQGRVFTTIGSVAMAVSPLSIAVAGPLADVVGMQPWYLAGGVTCVALAVMNRMIPSVVALESHEAPCVVAQAIGVAEAAAARIVVE
jgi:DHA3 family macrolide efflux protein-like MFS transporter